MHPSIPPNKSFPCSTMGCLLTLDVGLASTKGGEKEGAVLCTSLPEHAVGEVTKMSIFPVGL